jgi:hypothetical protein
MSRQGQRELVAADTDAVVANPDQLRPATLYSDVDAPRTSIETVLEQFLDDGRGPLDDLASSDLIDELGR